MFLGGFVGVNIVGVMCLVCDLGLGKIIVIMLCDVGVCYVGKLFNFEFFMSWGLFVFLWMIIEVFGEDV